MKVFLTGIKRNTAIGYRLKTIGFRPQASGMGWLCSGPGPSREAEFLSFRKKKVSKENLFGAHLRSRILTREPSERRMPLLKSHGMPCDTGWRPVLFCAKTFLLCAVQSPEAELLGIGTHVTSAARECLIDPF